jgi:6-pyruvoyltetrahydropterin/6-carboxytetrahydropterin synthase
MAHFLLSAEAAFAAAHTLPGVPQCERMHGHNWRVRLTVRVAAGALDDKGLAVDFRLIEAALRTVVADLDHQYLNELEAFRSNPPSAEHIATVVCERATDHLSRVAPVAHVEQVEVWEMPHYRVCYRPRST